jgi:hypothetical protein
MQGLILRKSLKAQKDVEDGSARMAIGNLHPKLLGFVMKLKKKRRC